MTFKKRLMDNRRKFFSIPLCVNPVADNVDDHTQLEEEHVRRVEITQGCQ